MPKVATRGLPVGVCNICGCNAHLTDDHIPPKGLLKPTQVEMLSLCESLYLEKFKKSRRFSQNGLKFKTLCANCNNNLLGSQSDPSLISFANEAKNLLKSSLCLPENIFVETKPNRLCRSVVGHLLAAQLDGHRIGTTTNSLTDYFLQTTTNLPSNIEIYYWLYPYSDQVIVQGAGWIRDLGSSFAVISLLKFFPFAFLIVSDKPSSWHFKFPSLNTYLSSDIEQVMSMPIDLVNIPAQRWPEMPGSRDALLHSDSAIRTKLQTQNILLR
jgi:hypothetical protein